MTRPKNRFTPEEILDQLTTSLTAYSTFESLVQACQNGLTLTLLPVGRSAKQNVRLAEALEARGCKVWKGMRSV